MSEYHDEKAARALESIAKSMIKIERQLEALNKTVKPLSNCVESHPTGGKQFHVTEY